MKRRGRNSTVLNLNHPDAYVFEQYFNDGFRRSRVNQFDPDAFLYRDRYVDRRSEPSFRSPRYESTL